MSHTKHNRSLFFAVILHAVAFGCAITFVASMPVKPALAQGGGKEANKAAEPAEPTEEESRQAKEDFKKKIEAELDEVEKEIETLKADASNASKEIGRAHV